MSKERSAPPTPNKTAPHDPKHIDPNDFTIFDGAVRAIESFMATENARDANLRLRAGFDLIPPEGKDYDYKSSSHLSVDLSAVRNLPRARSDVLKKHEEEKKRLDAIRRERQEKCPTSTRSSGAMSSSSSCSSISDRNPVVRQPAGGNDDDSQSSNSTATTSSFIEGAKSVLKNTMLMGTPHEPVQWKKLPAASTGRGERTPEKATTRRAITREISSATVYAVKGAGGTVVEETVPTVRSINTSDARSIALSPANLTPSDIGSPIVQKRIEIVEQDERRRRKEEDDNRMKKDEEKRKKREKDEEERKKREKDEEERKRKKEEDDKISSEMSKESINDVSEFHNDYVPKPKRYRKKTKRKCAHSISRHFSAHLQSVGNTASAAAAAAIERLRLSSGWITDLYHHYLLHVLASLGRAFPGAEVLGPRPRRGQIPYPLNRAIRRPIPSAEVFAVKYAANVVKKEEKKEVKREVKRIVKKEVKKESKKELNKEMKEEIKQEVNKEMKKEMKKLEESVKTAPTPRSLGVSPKREQETTSKTAEEISSGRDTLTKREIEDPPEPPFRKSADGLPTAIPTPTEQSIGFREVQSSKRSNIDSSYCKDEDTLNNIKSIDEDDWCSRRTESDTSIISNDPAHPEASFDFKKLGDKRTELSFQVHVHKNKIFSPIVLQPSRVVTVPNLSMEPL
ncbi:hypothetical protein PRIPAC_71928 [Pristionchus pacificus]|uniref:Uncharacterized protein n=1 Tax=Pristionchus pacificus TaxID=54126 RepID=A0A2A6CZN1_PRIPA|nr:hypothetical protein PRIPAC_71928 [Pristionchus pacificus]|eukprot:PDM83684.1 hypothetical protein PRIPAC_30171 [Pristionchus pacificus]